MAEDTKVIRDDIYEDIASTFQCIEVFELDEALKDCGIEDEELRKKICSRYFFGIGNFHDQYWFKHEDKKYYPLLCFSETFLDTITDENKLGNLYVKSNFFEFHSYSEGAVDEHYDENSELPPIEFGDVGLYKVFFTK